MGSKYIRSITKVLTSAANRIFGAGADGVPAELLPADVRTLLSVWTVTQTETAISTAVNTLIGGAPGLLDTLDELSAALGDDANFAATVTTALAGKVDSSSLSESIDDRVAALLVAGTNITLTYNDASGTLTVASTAGGLSGTGSVDNAALRSDGTGGATLQSSSWIINDNLTASPNNTINHACLEATGGTTNVSVSIKPKGTGAFCLAAPDGTAAGGNVRGANAVDLQTSRGAETQVASGANAVAIGTYSTASGTSSIAIGRQAVCSGVAAVAIGYLVTASNSEAIAIGASNTASGANSVGIGASNTASGVAAVAIGYANTASGNGSAAIGYSVVATAHMSTATGYQSRADRAGMTAHAYGQFSSGGDAQAVRFVLRNKTTNTTPTTLFLEGSATRLTIPSGKKLTALVWISGIKSDGSSCAEYLRKVSIKNVGGTTSLIGSVETIGTDVEDNASTDVAITADNTNDALQISVTGITGETWRWVAVVDGLEVAYGT